MIFFVTKKRSFIVQCRIRYHSQPESFCIWRLAMATPVGISSQSMLFLQALVASVSICFVPTAPLVASSSIASTTASPTRSTCSGFSTIDPRNCSLLPKRLLNSDPRNPPNAIGSVNFLVESYMNAGRIKILRRSESFDDMVASASLLVVIYLLGRMGAPPAAEMYTNVETCSFNDS